MKLPDTAALKERLAPVLSRWQTLAPREKLMLAAGTGVVLLYLFFALLIQPAWRTLRSAPAQLEQLDTQLQSMQKLAAEARELRELPPVNADQAQAALRAASDRLGDKGRLSLQGDRAVLTVTNIGSGQLRAWLSEVRSGARARPVEAGLTRGANGYSGTVVVALGGGA